MLSWVKPAANWLSGAFAAPRLIWTIVFAWVKQSGMTLDPTDPAPKLVTQFLQPSPKDRRLERQKAALKANMARRKAQARAKAGQGAAITNNQEQD